MNHESLLRQILIQQARSPRLRFSPKLKLQSIIHQTMGKKQVSRQRQDKDEHSSDSHTTVSMRFGATLDKSSLRKAARRRVLKTYKNTGSIRTEPQMASKCSKFSSTIDLESLECPICLEVLVEPVTLSCHHSFCQRCLEENRSSKAFSERCPLCRRECWHEHSQPSLVLAGLIETYLVNNQDEVIPYTCRKADHLEWLRQRKDIDFSMGAPIDFQDHQGKWNLGYVTAVEEIASMFIIDVAPQGSLGKSCDCHRFNKETHRLAPAGFFSHKKQPKQEIPLFFQEMDEIQIEIQRQPEIMRPTDVFQGNFCQEFFGSDPEREEATPLMNLQSELDFLF